MDNAQELIQRLNHSGKKLSKSHRRIAECIVTHYDKVVFMTASKLGEYVGVSESTVVRFASALGYSGYPHLQKALQELIRHRLTASQRFEMTSDMDHAQVLNKVLKADIQNIRSTLDEMDINAFEDAIEKIISARNIYVLGLRASAPIAEFLAHYLRFIFPNVTVVTSGISDVFEQLSRIGEGDLLAFFLLGAHILPAFVGKVDFAALYLAVGSLDKTEVVDPCINAQGRDQTDVRAFRRLDRAEASVVGVVYVSDFETGTVAGQTAGTQRGQTTLVRHFRQRVGLVHELRELARSEEGVDHRRERLGVDQVGRAELFAVAYVHPLADRPGHTGKTYAELVGELFADRAYPTVAEVVDIVHRRP